MKKGSRFIHNTGKSNTFVGFDSGSFSVTGMGNVGFGTDSLLNISTGMGNSGIGFSALVNNRAGNGNTAIGVMTLEENRDGYNNTALGCYALSSNIAGSGNIAIGAKSGLLLSDGNDNIYVGNIGQLSENGSIRIGSPEIHSTVYIHGIFGALSRNIGIPVEIDNMGQLKISPSSKKFKKNIATLSFDSDRLYNLRPVSFTYNNDENNIIQYGLVAEEVNAMFPELVVLNENNEPHAVRYQVLPVLLLYELQKQYALIQALTKRLDTLESRLPQ
jgi:hypothetical protein